MIGLIRSWRESVAVFVPKNFKLFFLAVLNTFVQSLVPFLLYFGIFIIGALAPLGLNNTFLQDSYNVTLIAFLVSAFSIMTISFGMYVTVRPSVARKNARYFLGFGLHFIWFVIFELLLRILNASIELTVGYTVRLFVQALIISPFVVYFYFFLLDSRPNFVQQLRNLKSALMFVLYNLPFCLISGFLFFVLPHFVSSQMIFPGRSIIALYLLIWIFTSLFTFSWFCVMYTKRVYEQYELYK